MQYLHLNGKKFYYDEIAAYSFRNSIEINGYEAKTLEFCRNWLIGLQEFSIHTSGSTGTPKLITFSREQLEISANQTLKLLHLQKNDRALVNLNIETVGGMMMLVRGFIGKLQLTILEPSGNPFAQIPASESFDFQSYVPLQIQNIFEQTPEKQIILNSAKAILIGGAPIHFKLDQLIQQIKAPVYHTYGMTETVSHIALRRVNGPEKQDFYQAPQEIELQTDVRGCLTIKAPVTNSETIITNDLVEMLSPHTFKWLGRADNTINSGGVKIQLEKIELALEEALFKLNIHRRHFVSSLPDEKLGEKIIAVLEGTPLSEADENNLKNLLQSKLSKYEAPKQFGYLPQFHETKSGKIDKLKNRDALIF